MTRYWAFNRGLGIGVASCTYTELLQFVGNQAKYALANVREISENEFLQAKRSGFVDYTSMVC